MSYLEFRKDIASIMKTCHTLRYAGVPLLLRFPVRLYALDKVTSFHQFMLAAHDITRRFQQLRRLEYRSDILGCYEKTEAENTADCLAEVLQNSQKLEYLTLSVTDDFLKPGFRDALKQLSSLRTLVLHQVRLPMVETFAAMHMPLTNLELTFSTPENAPLPFDLLGHFLTSLTQLSMTFATLHDTNVQYLHVHTLELRFPRRLVSPFAAHLIHIFPRVAKLVLTGVNSSIRDDHREDNMEAISSLHFPWPKLEFLGGIFSSLYALGWTLPVRYLDIQQLDPLDVPDFLSLLRELQPVCLDIDLFQERPANSGVSPPWRLDTLEEFFWGISQLPRITHLILGFTFEWKKPSVKKVLARFTETMHGSHITFLALYLLGRPRTPRPFIKKAAKTMFQDWETVQDYPKGLIKLKFTEMLEFALNVARTISTLNYIYFFDGRSTASFWSIKRPNTGNVTLKEEDETMGVEMMERAREISSSS